MEQCESRDVPATFYINSTGDAGDSNPNDQVAWTGNMVLFNGEMVREVTLRAAIEQANAMASTANDPHLITLELAEVILNPGDPPPPPPPPRVVALTSPLPDIHQFVVIDGLNRDLFKVTRDTTAAGFRFFSIASAPNTPAIAVTFKNMTISDSGFTAGLQGGAFLVGTAPSTASLTLEQVTLSNNQANEGGAVYVDAGSELVLKNCLLDGNEAVGAGNEGGAVRITGTGQMRAYDSTFSNNKALGSKGGAISLNTSVQIVLTDTDLIANEAAEGGAVYASIGNANLTPVKMTGGVVACNTSTKFGGAFLLSTANAQFTGVNFTGNSSAAGGALFAKLCKVELFGCSFDGNTAAQGPKVAYTGDLYDNVWIYIDNDCTGISNADRIKYVPPVP